MTAPIRARRSVPVAAALAAAAVLLTGCAHGGPHHGPVGHHGPGPQGAQDLGDAGSAAEGSAQVAPGISEDAATQLCTDLDDQLTNMRTYTHTPGRVTLNTTVATWAPGHGVDLFELSRNRDRVDEAMIAVCPQTRDEVLSALGLPTVAAGLLGF